MRYQVDGATIILQRAGPGAILAEASLFSERYHCDAISAALTRTFAVSKKKVLALLKQGQDFAEAFAEHLAREIQGARLRSEILSLKTVAQRLDTWLTWHEGHLPAKGEWKTVAIEIGASPEALYRELARRRT